MAICEELAALPVVLVLVAVDVALASFSEAAQCNRGVIGDQDLECLHHLQISPMVHSPADPTEGISTENCGSDVSNVGLIGQPRDGNERGDS